MRCIVCTPLSEARRGWVIVGKAGAMRNALREVFSASPMITHGLLCLFVMVLLPTYVDRHYKRFAQP